MSSLFPPSSRSFVQNTRVLVEDWRGRTGLARYYIASQVASTIITAVCALGASLAVVVEDWTLYFGLLVASSLCLLHAAGTWHLLRRRYLVRYDIW